MAITSTLGGSGSYIHAGSGNSYTLFTTPAATSDTLFIVYLTQYNATGDTQVNETKKLMVGPSTAIRVSDDTSLTGNTTIYHYIGMVIS